jgi:thiol-disulfide isomerase/thioredoxin
MGDDFIFLRKHLFDIILVVIFGFIFVQKIPSIIRMYNVEGKVAQTASVVGLDGQPFSIPLPTKHVLVFWATWCGPCKVELGRINKMILNGEIAAESVLAVSVSEDLNLVSSFVREQKYLFKIGVDLSGQAAALYRISGTPTILLIDSDQKVTWMTTGLSPSLEFRIRSFLKM